MRDLSPLSMTLHRVHDLDGNVIAEYDAAGTLLTEYVWLEDRPLAVVADAGTALPQTLWVHTDHFERPAVMTDDSANIVWRASYLPFGEVHDVLLEQRDEVGAFIHPMDPAHAFGRTHSGLTAVGGF